MSQAIPFYMLSRDTITISNKINVYALDANSRVIDMTEQQMRR